MLETHAGDCRIDFTRSAISVAIYEAEANNPSPGANQAAMDAIKRHLRCSPMQSNAWFLLAVFETRTAANDDFVSEHLALSYRLGPREAWIAARRVLFLCGLPGGIPERFQSDALSDFLGLMEAGRITAAIEAYRACDSKDRTALDATIASSSPQARAAFAKAIGAGQ
jgi:hypothetical protein